MGKNIVICCDGTGNEYSDRNSNVVKLYSTLIVNASQIAYYHPGVGTMGSPTARNGISKQWSRVKGLAVGAGLLDNVSDAYRYLMDMYADGDRLFLFGFSRGAYTVRVLSGMLYMYGLLCPGNDGLIRYVARMFAKRSRDARGDKSTLECAQGFKETFSRDCPIHFIGVWDTVDSVGWLWDPVVLPFSGQNPIVEIGRQALAIDERRSFYEPKVWGSPVRVPKTGRMQDIKQVWFAGAHSDVGGSYQPDESGPAELALRWMLDEALKAGLLIREAKVPEVLKHIGTGTTARLHDPLVDEDPLRPLWLFLECIPRRDDREHRGKGAWRLPDFGRRRVIPENSLLHESVIRRMRSSDPNEPYNPPNLPQSYEIEPPQPYRAAA